MDEEKKLLMFSLSFFGAFSYFLYDFTRVLKLQQELLEEVGNQEHSVTSLMKNEELKKDGQERFKLVSGIIVSPNGYEELKKLQKRADGQHHKGIFDHDKILFSGQRSEKKWFHQRRSQKNESFECQEFNMLDPKDSQQHVNFTATSKSPWFFNLFQSRKTANQKNFKVNFIAYEGSLITILGVFKYDKDSQQITMTKLCGLFGGGLKELKTFIQSQKNLLNFGRLTAIFGISLCSLLMLRSFLIFKQRRDQKKQREQLQREQDRQFPNLIPMPTEKAQEQGAFCLICYKNPSNVILRPCYHLCLCIDCFKIYTRNFIRDPECPCCRKKIENNNVIMVEYADNDQDY